MFRISMALEYDIVFFVHYCSVTILGRLNFVSLERLPYFPPNESNYRTFTQIILVETNLMFDKVTKFRTRCYGLGVQWAVGVLVCTFEINLLQLL